MKKITFCAAAAALLTSSAVFAGGPDIIPEDYYTGIFVGGTGAFHHVSFDGSSSVVLPNDITFGVPPQVLFPATTFANNNISGSDYAGYGGVQGGIGKVFAHQWYLGVVGFGEWGNASNTATNSIVNPAVTTTSVFLVPIPPIIITDASATASSSSSQTTVKIENDYGVAAKFGYVINPGTLFYGKVGIEWANLKVSNTTTAAASRTRNIQGVIVLPEQGPVTFLNTTVSTTASAGGSSSNEDTKDALLLGIGAEQFVYRDMVSINVEYDYANFGSVKTVTNLIANVRTTVTDNLTGVTVTPINQTGISTPVLTQATASAKVSILLAGLNFYFGHNWF